ncbi:MAG TPA: glycosyltransferase [Verrucomicrobiae bacterium]|nr:glycosyltransferase [Verrucomicrobiae bacterium]
MKISIVVPAFNEQKLIGATLQSIQDAAKSFVSRGWETEIIVCDNNSTDCTSEIARAAGATVVFEPVNQIARARNKGASIATGEWLIFVDADSHPTAELFADVAEQFASGNCLGGGCVIRMDERHFFADRLTSVWNWVSRLRKWSAGSFIFCRTSAFCEVGGFNLELFASEEIDLSNRLKKLARARGEKLVILHKHPMLTSARKMHLYSRKEYFRFFRKAIFSPRATIKSREACMPWYDGRR